MNFRFYAISFRFFSLLFAVFAVGACAKVMPLTGGEQDADPPAYRSSRPDTFARNFGGKEILIRFDEYLVLKDPTREIVISPLPDNLPEIEAFGKNLRIRFKDSLRSGFTYIIQFGKSLTDLNEGNANTDFRFVFSTGAVLDTGSIRGRVTDAFRVKPAEGFKVMLYEKTCTDSFPYFDKPLYITYTDEAGMFSFRNIREDDYRIFALKEENNNYLYDRPGEEIAFAEGFVSTEDDGFIELFSFKEEVAAPELVKVRSLSRFKTEFSFSAPVPGLQILALNIPQDIGFSALEWSASRDSVWFWHADTGRDSLSFSVELAGKTDTVSVKVNRSDVQEGKKSPKPAQRQQPVLFSAAGNMAYSRYTEPYLLFSEPPLNVQADFFTFTADSLPLDFSVYPDSLNPRKWHLRFDIKGIPKLVLQSDSGAVTGLSGKSFPPCNFTFSPRAEKEYGEIRINLSDSVTPVPKLWRLESSGKVVREILTDGVSRAVSFKRLEPGTYQLFMVSDSDGDGRWTAGNFYRKRLPEKVLLMQEPIQLKQGWDAELEWKINPMKKGKSK
jgi:hypothetical protein